MGLEPTPREATPREATPYEPTRRQFLATTAKLGAASALAGSLPASVVLRPSPGAAAPSFFTAGERRTLDAALARMIPADGPGDWSAADVGAGDYIERLLAADLSSDPAGVVYAGGPYRQDFPNFQPLTRTKREAWQHEIERLRVIYRDGIAECNVRAGGDFAARPAFGQDMVLSSLDGEGHPFFTAFYAHTMEAVYAHPVYRASNDYRPWDDLGYEGDVHGWRFPGIGPPDASWNVFGGYAPEEMAQPGGSAP